MKDEGSNFSDNQTKCDNNKYIVSDNCNEEIEIKISIDDSPKIQNFQSINFKNPWKNEK